MKGDDVDITDATPAAEVVPGGEQPWRQVIRHIPSICFAVDPNCTVLWLNSRAASYLGFAATELAGRSLLDFVLEDDREIVRTSIASCLADLDLAEQSHGREVRTVCKDGTVCRIRQSAGAVRWSD